MKVDIAARHIELTPALRQFTEEKLSKLERVLDGPIEAHVVLWITKHRHTAEIQVKSGSLVLTGTEETGDLYASIGEVVDKLERQALRHKEKLRTHKHRQSPRDPEIAATIEANVARDVGGDGDERASRPRIVSSKRCHARPMSTEDALRELEASQEDLLVFRESMSDRIQVLYRQRDGGIGLIDSES